VEQLLRGRLTVPPHEPVSLAADSTVDWQLDPFTSRTWHMWLHSLAWLEPFHIAWEGTGDRRFLEASAGVVRAWVQDTPVLARNVGPWHDHATAMRAFTMSCLASYLARPRWLLAALESHGEVMADPRRYAGPYNHGINQDLSLIAVAHQLQRLDWLNFARDRLATVAATSVDDVGVIDEQSTEYSNYLHSLWSQVLRVFDTMGWEPPETMPERLARMPTFMAHATMPDGHYVPLGDSFRRTPAAVGAETEFVRSKGMRGRKPPERVKVFTGGYVFGRSGWGENRPYEDETYYSLRFGPGRYRHGHEDHTSLTYSSRGHRLIVDSGHCNYERDEYRQHLVSPAAHSLVDCPAGTFVPGQPCTLMRHELGPSFDFFEVADAPYSGVTRIRRLWYVHALECLIVHDEVLGEESGSYRQLWHFDENLAVVEQHGDRVVAEAAKADKAHGVRLTILQLAGVGTDPVTVHKGETAPYLGWVSHNVDQRAPAPVVAFPAMGKRIEFITVLVASTSGDTVTAHLSENEEARRVKLQRDGCDYIVDLGPTRVFHRVRHEGDFVRDGHRPPAVAGFYQLPVRVHNDAGAIALDTQDTGLHAIVSGDLPVYVYFRPGTGPLLNVMFHSTVDRSKRSVPYFDRLEASQDMPGSVLLVSDPTLFVEERLQLGWYVGTRRWDPTATVREIVHSAAAASGASKLIFIGSSGGGFPALRYSSIFPDSLALAINPHVDLFRYYRSWVRILLETAFPGIDRDDAERWFRPRFSVLDDYQKGTGTNKVLYAQSGHDTNPLTNHLPAFIEAAGMEARKESPDGRIRVLVEDHGAEPRDLDAFTFERLYALALEMLDVEG
jgi:hypothetical protein